MSKIDNLWFNSSSGISMEEKKAKRILLGSSSAREKDMISNLPDSLISQILSYLPTKDAVRTSVLSKSWKSLLLLSPELVLDSCEFPDYNAFASFVDRCLDFSREEKSCVHKLKLSIRKGENDNQSCVTRWIDIVSAHKLKHLDVECFVRRKCLEVIPVSLFICETLLYLRLHEVLFGSFEDSSSVSLPRLKTMSLEFNIYANEKSLESLISSCHVLEDLSIVRRQDDNVKVLRVRSQSLINLSIQFCFRHNEVVDVLVPDDSCFRDMGVLIDAPRLEHLNIENEMSASKTISNSSSLTKVNILGDFYLDKSADQVCKFFSSFSSVKDLKMSAFCFMLIKDVVLLPQFCNLSCLEAELALFDLETLPLFLASCPNLRSLILDIGHSYVGKQMRVSPVPLCLLSSLEFVEIECSHFDVHHIVKLVRYFVENSVILKKLVLRFGREIPNVLSDILALPRRSSTCQIIVC